MASIGTSDTDVQEPPSKKAKCGEDGENEKKSPSVKEATQEAKNGGKEGIKDSVKDGGKDGVKDGVKDSVKDGVKDGFKEGVKDGVKDGFKDAVKDAGKDAGKVETGKEDSLEELPLQTETDVGISEYLSDHAPMTGIIKQRWSDFLVREVDLEGNVVKLTGTEVPEEIQELSVTSLTDLLTEEQFAKLHAFSEKKDPEDTFVIEASEDKEKRTEMHKAIKTFYPDLVTNTIEKEGQKKLEIKWKPSKSDQRQRWPKSRGEYCKFVLYKENMDTMDCINLISKKTRLRSSFFTYAGTKDKRARTTQHVSVHKVNAEKLLGMNKILRGVVLGNFQYVKEPLKLGDLNGNRFAIVIRNFTASDDDLKKAMNTLADIGFINYYGLQRFGTTSVPTHHVGRALLQSKWTEAIDLILKPRSGDQADLAAARQEWLKSKDAKACLKHLRHRHCIEKFLLEGIQKYSKNDLVTALSNISRNTRHMYIHSYQSYVWNTVVSKRISKLGLKAVVGDLVLPRGWKKSNAVQLEGKTSVKPVVITEENLHNYSINDVVMPLPGYDVTYPTNEAATWFKDLLHGDDLYESQLKNKVKDYSLPGDYRHMVVKPEDVIWEKKSYDDPNKPLILSDHDIMKGLPIESCKEGKLQALILEFTLPSSCYATMALREVLKGDTAPSSQAQMNVT